MNHEVAEGLQASLAYYGAVGDGYQQSSYGRTDVTVSKAGAWDGARWRVVLGLRKLDNPLTVYSVGSPDPLFSRYDSRLQGVRAICRALAIAPATAGSPLMPSGRRTVLRLAVGLAVSPAVKAAVIDPGLVFVFAGPESPGQRAALAAVRSQFARVLSGPDLSSLPSGSKPAACIALGPAALQTAVDQRVVAPLLCVLASQQSFRRATAAGSPSLRATAIYAEPSPSQQMRLIAALYKRTVVVGVLLSEQSTVMGALLLQAAAEHRLELLVSYVDPSLPLSRNLLRLASATVLLIFPDSALYTQTSLRELLETTYRRRQPVIGFSESLVAAGTLASAYSSIGDTLRQLQPMVTAAVAGRLPPAQFPRYWQVAVNDSVARSLDVIVDDEVRRLGDRP